MRLKEDIAEMQKTLEESQASQLQEEEWGMRNLANDIQKQKRGYYVRLEYESLPQAVKDFERELRLSEDAMRFMSVVRAAPSDGQSPIPPGSPGSRSASRSTDRAAEVSAETPQAEASAVLDAASDAAPTAVADTVSETPPTAPDPAAAVSEETAEATASEPQAEAQGGSETAEPAAEAAESEEKTDGE